MLLVRSSVRRKETRESMGGTYSDGGGESQVDDILELHDCGNWFLEGVLDGDLFEYYAEYLSSCRLVLKYIEKNSIR